MVPMNIADTPTFTAPVPRDSMEGSAIGVMSRRYLRGTRLGIHAHREAQLLFAAQGLMQVTTPKGQWLVPPTRAVWLPPRVEHAVDVLADIEMRALLVEPAWLMTHARSSRLQREFVVRVEQLLRETVLALFGESTEPLHIAALAQVALFELCEAEDAVTFIPLPKDPRARRVAELVLAEPAAARGLDHLARLSGTSTRTITRLFAAETDLTFKEWRRRARIMAAVQALENRTTSIKQISSRLGFQSVAAFSYAFRQVMGVTPSAFRSMTARPFTAHHE